MDLTGKVAIVTGGTKGIGKAIVQAFIDCGARVAVAARNIDAAEKLANEIGGERAIAVKVDVSRSDDVIQMFDHVQDTYGRLDILVNNAGVSTMDFVENMKEEHWDKVMDINAKGSFLCSKLAAQVMKKQAEGGKIINISSQAGKNGYVCMGSYVASKHAVLGLTKVMALELAKHRINVNAVCPGIVETDMKKTERVWGGDLRGIGAKAVEEEDCSQVPLGRTAQPEDIANVVVFLASKYADYMTGQSINVTGGMTMN
ncbi:SDR family NAD(P)-dependent oxidoreductase [Brevibacillus sp. NRS-1366]|uniref:SDR family NAD(P)-dependent oxidoreductase n=1 Tax=Brevibacillus sp. NRS-1366 TaxID=3233899 RepID=UPI003D1B8AEB